MEWTGGRGGGGVAADGATTKIVRFASCGVEEVSRDGGGGSGQAHFDRSPCPPDRPTAAAAVQVFRQLVVVSYLAAAFAAAAAVRQRREPTRRAAVVARSVVLNGRRQWHKGWTDRGRRRGREESESFVRSGVDSEGGGGEVDRRIVVT